MEIGYKNRKKTAESSIRDITYPITSDNLYQSQTIFDATHFESKLITATTKAM